MESLGRTHVFPGMSPGREHCDMGTINGLVQGKNYINLSIIGPREELDKFTQFYIIFINLQDTSGGFHVFSFSPSKSIDFLMFVPSLTSRFHHCVLQVQEEKEAGTSNLRARGSNLTCFHYCSPSSSPWRE
jgi:hypothetical protein